MGMSSSDSWGREDSQNVGRCHASVLPLTEAHPVGTEALRAHLLEPLDLVLQLHLAGPGTELAQARG